MDNNRHVDDLVQKIAHDQGYVTHKYHITQKFDKGENYVGEIKRASIEGAKSDGKTEEIKVIIKTSPQGMNEKGIPITKYYECEDFAYNKYFPALYELQDKAGLGDEAKIKFAKCYGSSLEYDKEVFIFEDLNAAGYKLVDRMKALDAEHARFVIKTEAKYHALSYAFKLNSTEDEYESYKNLSPIKQEFSESYFKYCREICEVLEEHVVDADCKEKLREFAKSDMKQSTFEYMDFNKTVQEAPYNIIIHGDIWSNNYLFKYDDKNKVMDMIIIDWQTIRPAPPICDLIITLYISLDEATREELWDELLDLYYNTLRNSLRELNCDPDECYPESVYRKHLKDKMGFALVTAIVTLPFTLVEKDNTFDMAEFMEQTGDEYDTSLVKLSKECIDRVNGVLRHLIKIKAI